MAIAILVTVLDGVGAPSQPMTCTLCQMRF